MLKIWEKLELEKGEWSWEPKSRDTGLQHFIKDAHPAIRDMRAMVDGYVLSVVRAIKYWDKEERKKLIEEAVIDSWKYDHLEEDDKKKQTDREILCDLWQIYISNDGSMEVDGETISFVNWSGKSKLDMDEKDLDAHWDLIWEWNQDDQYYGSDELKDWIWNEQYFGLKRSLLPKIQLPQQIIPDGLRKDIDARVKIVNEKVADYASAWMQFEKEREKGGKYEGKSFMKLDLAGEAPDIEKIYFADDLWKDLDHKGLVKKFEKAEKAKKAAQKKKLHNALLDQWDEKQGTLTYKPYVAGRVEGYKTREDMKNAGFLGGEKEPAFGNNSRYDDDADGGIFFTPEWGESKGINEIEDFLKHIAKERKLKKAFFYVMWFADDNGCFSCGNEETRIIRDPSSMTRLSNHDKHSYFQWKDDELEEIVHRDFPKKGCLNGSEGEIARAIAISNGKKEWKWNGETWTQKKWIVEHRCEEWKGEF